MSVQTTTSLSSAFSPQSLQQLSQQISIQLPQLPQHRSEDMDLMVAEEVDNVAEEVVAEEEVITTVQALTATVSPQLMPTSPQRAKILLTISDDLCYTMTIIGDNLSALIAGIGADEQVKNEWHSWHRFVTNPHQFFVYIFDTDFGQYVRYRDCDRIRHLSKIKIKNKFYVSQQTIGSVNSQNSLIDVLDAEPTDALVSDQLVASSLSATMGSSPSTPTQSTTRNQINRNVNQTTILNSSQYHHNYHISSPSAPLTTTSSHTISSSSTALAPVDSPNKSTEVQTRHKSNTNSKHMTKAAKKSFNNSTTNILDTNGADLLADAPTGPTHDWTPEQTVTFLELCKNASKELSPKKNVLEVKPFVWEQLAKHLNSKGFGYFDALLCRTHFSRLRSTYTNILCYPALVDETRWPYFELMKEIIGEKPLELQPKVNTRAQTLAAKRKSLRGRPLKMRGRPPLGQERRHSTSSGSVMKNSANQEVSELYVALLNLVKKYMKYFETEKKNQIWNRIEKEMNGAGYKWNANALRGLFHRLRYTYLNILRSVGDEELATASWPYFRYFHDLDLSAFRSRKSDEKFANKSLKPMLSAPQLVPNQLTKRRPGRPRKVPLIVTSARTDSGDGMTSDLSTNADNNCEVQFYEYSSDASDEDRDDKGVENINSKDNKSD